MKFNKRMVSMTLILSLLMSLLPSSLVLADRQDHVTNVRIENQFSAANYRFRLTWSLNLTNTVDPDFGSLAANTGDGDQPHGHDVINYDITTTNVTKNNYQIRRDELKPNAAGIFSTTQEFTHSEMLRGSLYSVKVTPWHNNHIFRYVAGVQERIPGRANYNADPPQSEVLYMSSIKVDAEGTFDEDTNKPGIKVTWDNPNYRGVNRNGVNNDSFFAGYNIYYGEGGNSPENVNWTRVYVNTADTTVNRVPDTVDPDLIRLEKIITADNIIPGRKYSIKVEPCYLPNVELRPSTGSLGQSSVIYNNRAVSIAFQSRNDFEYRIDDVGIAVPVNLSVLDANNLILSWGNVIPELDLSRIEVYQFTTSNSIPIRLMTLYPPVSSFTTVPIPKTGGTVTYYVEIYYKDANGNEVLDPIETRQPYPSYDISTINITPNRPEIKQIAVEPLTPSGSGLNTYDMTVSILPYKRIALTQEEKDSVANEGDEIIDYDVDYDIWVSDDYTTILNSDNFNPIRTQSFSAEDLRTIVVDGLNVDVLSFDSISNYIPRGYDGISPLPTIKPSKLYYVKIIARKTTISNAVNSSAPALESIYISIDGETSVPSTMSKPPLTTINPTNSTLTLRWKNEWFEVYQPPIYQTDEEGNDILDDDGNRIKIGGDVWYTDNVAIRNGKLVFGNSIVETDTIVENFYSVSSKEALDKIFMDAGYDFNENGEFVFRRMDISNCRVAMRTMLFSDIEGIDYERYLNGLLSEESDGNWNSLTWPLPNSQSEITTNDGYSEYTLTGLDPNTTYVILFRAYRFLSDDNRPISYPTFIIDTTLPGDSSIDIDPTVPKLGIDTSKTTDTSIVLQWEFDPSLNYIVMYSDIYSDFPNGGMAADMSNVSISTINDREYMVLQIDNLFPETTYYFWIYAEYGSKISYPSNPVDEMTKSMDTPNPPTGLGIASKDIIDIINDRLDTSYKTVDGDYMIIEWHKNSGDTSTNPNPVMTVTGGSAESIGIAENTDSYLVKFNGLIANTSYFIRAKTTLTLVQNASKVTSKVYSYTIQLSPTEDFVDYIEVIIPSLPDISTARNYIRKESAWNLTIRRRTGMTTDEYDTDINRDYYILPDEDFEITYNERYQILKYRFRSGGEDEEGNADHRVDQRLISKLITNRAYTYIIDITSYNREAILTREVEIPYTILNALTQNKVDFAIRANNIIMTLTPGMLDTQQLKAVTPFGDSAFLSIRIEEDPSDTPPLKTYAGERLETYISIPQRITMQMITPSQSLDITYTAVPLKMQMKLSNRYDAYDRNIETYMKADNQWRQVLSTFQREDAKMNFTTATPGIYCVIATNAPRVTTYDSSVDSMQTVASKIKITDMLLYQASSHATSTQLLNMINAVATNKKEVAINDIVSQDVVDTLRKAGLLPVYSNSIGILREAAINSLVVLYERKSGYQVIINNTLQTTPYSDIQSASEIYQRNLLKAAEIGFLENNQANPKTNLTLGEMFKMINIIMG